MAPLEGLIRQAPSASRPRRARRGALAEACKLAGSRAASPEVREEVLSRLRETSDKEERAKIVNDSGDVALWGAWALGYKNTYGCEPEATAEDRENLWAMAKTMGGVAGVANFLAWRWPN